jgi:hypothetical protein
MYECRVRTGSPKRPSLAVDRSRASLRSAMYLHPCGSSLPRFPALRDVPTSLWLIAPALPCAPRCTYIPVGKNGGSEEPPPADSKASNVASSMNQRHDVNLPVDRRLYGKILTGGSGVCGTDARCRPGNVRSKGCDTRLVPVNGKKGRYFQFAVQFRGCRLSRWNFGTPSQFPDSSFTDCCRLIGNMASTPVSCHCAGATLQSCQTSSETG